MWLMTVCHCMVSPIPSPLVQFQLLHSKYHLCSASTRGILLSSYVKFINLFPEIKPQIQEVMKLVLYLEYQCVIMLVSVRFSTLTTSHVIQTRSFNKEQSSTTS